MSQDSPAHRFRVEIAPAPKGLAELQRLTEELWDTDGWRIKRDLDGIHRTWNVLYSNWQVQGSFIGRFKQDGEYAMSVWGNARDRTKWDQFLDLVDVAMHNYIASVIALADHTSKVADRVLRGEAHTGYRCEYNRKFRKNARSCFVRGLRNYLLHQALPIARGSFHYEKDGPFTHAIMLSVAALRDGKWNAEARRYMDDAGEELDIYETLLGHYKDTLEFQKWFEKLVFDSNKKAIAEANAIAERRNTLAEPVQKELEETTEDGEEVPYIAGQLLRRSLVSASRRLTRETDA